MSTVLAWTLMAGFVGSLVYVGVRLNQAMQFRYVTSTRVAVNDGQVTESSFLKLLEEARDSMIIYDDGDFVDGYIYMDQGITEAVKQKLESHPTFHLHCLFNFDEPELVFRKALIGTSPRVEIKTYDPRQPRLATHYKIIDNGAKAYLSRYLPRETTRYFRIVDCTRVPKAHSNRVSNVVLGEYKNHFRRAFSEAGESATI